MSSVITNRRIRVAQCKLLQLRRLCPLSINERYVFLVCSSFFLLCIGERIYYDGFGFSTALQECGGGGRVTCSYQTCHIRSVELCFLRLGCLSNIGRYRNACCAHGTVQVHCSVPPCLLSTVALPRGRAPSLTYYRRRIICARDWRRCDPAGAPHRRSVAPTSSIFRWLALSYLKFITPLPSFQ